MSVAVVIGPALACSGETYCAVPITMPLCVRCAASIARAIPKSVIFTCPSGVISRFPGLMSRCTMPASCAAATAPAAAVRRGSGLAVVEDPRDPRVRQGGGVPRLGAEALLELLVRGVRRGQQLDRDRPLEHDIGAAPDLAHAPGRYAMVQPVALAQH